MNVKVACDVTFRQAYFVVIEVKSINHICRPTVFYYIQYARLLNHAMSEHDLEVHLNIACSQRDFPCVLQWWRVDFAIDYLE